MRTDMSDAAPPAYYTIRQAAWILGVQPSTVSRAIRLGTLRTVRRHGRLVVPASALTLLLTQLVHVETAAESASGCPSCGVVSMSVKEYVVTAPRDIPYGERGISLVWHKRRWRCVESTCARGSFTEAIEEVPAGWRTTGRLRRAIAAAVGDACRSVAEAAGSWGVSWPTAHAGCD